MKGGAGDGRALPLRAVDDVLALNDAGSASCNTSYGA